MGVDYSASVELERSLIFLAEVKHPVAGDLFLYRSPNSKELIGEVRSLLNTESGSVDLKTEFCKRKEIISPYLPRVHCFAIEETKSLCSNYNNLTCHFQYYKENLQTAIQQQKGTPFDLQFIKNLAKSLVIAVAKLHEQGLFQIYITPANVMICGANRFKFLDKMLKQISIEEPIYNASYVKKFNLDTDITSCLNERKNQLANFDPYKADSWSVGCTLLRAMTLNESSSIYDEYKIRINQSQVQLFVNMCSKQYGKQLSELVGDLLAQQPQHRASLRDLVQSVRYW